MNYYKYIPIVNRLNTYIYIYIERERERENKFQQVYICEQICLCVCV